MGFIVIFHDKRPTIMKLRVLHFTTIMTILINSNNINAHHNVIIWYPSLEDDFLEFLEEFGFQNIHSDPIWKWKSEFLNVQCQKIREARVFRMQSEAQNNMMRSLTFEMLDKFYTVARSIKEKKAISYSRNSVFIKQQGYNLSFFRCLINSEMTLFWYITYGFHGQYMYAFKERESNLSEGPPHLELVGMVEVSVRLNPIFRSQRHLERYFLNAHRMKKSVPLNSDVLCSLTANQQFRLCCIVEDSLKQRDYREFYVTTKYNHSCLEHQRVKILDYEDSGRRKYLTTDIRVNLMICEYNENQSEKTFLLASDPRGEFAVFVLEKKEDPPNVYDEFFLIAHIQSIPLIEYARKIY